MTPAAFDHLVEDLKVVCKKGTPAPFPLEEVYEAAKKRKDDHLASLASIASDTARSGLAYDLLMLFDVVAATASLDAMRLDAQNKTEPVAAEVVDLWVRAAAARALWFERFVLWPTEEAGEKLEHLCDTAKKLGAESIARSLVNSGQPLNFTSFVGSIPARPVKK